MLKKFQNKKFIKKTTFILALFIIPIFTLWGSQSLIQSMSSKNYAGRIFNKRIPIPKFREALLATRIQFIMQLGDTYLEQEDKINLEPMAWDRIVLLYETSKRRIKVSDDEVSEFIQKQSIFSRGDGFDFKTYDYIVKNAFRMTPRQFEEKIRDELKITKLHEQITANAQLTEDEIMTAYRRENEEISVDYLRLDYEEFEDQVSLDEEEIEKFFDSNQDRFKKPVSFNLEYIFMPTSTEDIAQTNTFNNELVKEIYRKLKKRNNLKDTAQEFSLTAEETGLFSLIEPIPGIGWSMEIISMINDLEVDEISPLIKANEGWYILKLKERKDSYVPSLEEIAEEVKLKLTKTKTKKLAMERMAEMLKEVKEIKNPKKVNFQKIAKQFDLTPGSTDLFKRASYIPDIGSSDGFFKAFSDLEGKEEIVSGMVILEQGIFVIKLREKISIDEEKFAQEKEEFSNKLLVKEKQNLFTRFLIELKKEANIRVF